jgi:hypothetical protein
VRGCTIFLVKVKPSRASKTPAGGMEDVSVLKGGKPSSCFVRFAVAFTGVMLCVLVYAPRFSTLNTSYGTTTTDFPVTTATGVVVEEVAEDGGVAALDLDNQVGSPCASMPRHGICCDRSDGNADVCFMAGDVRTEAATLSLLLFPPAGVPAAAEVEERIRPYTRKWDGIVTKLIHEVTLRAARPEEQEAAAHRCDVRHDAPVHVVTAGGYNGGNYFHAFNDGFLPAWLTAQHLSRRVVLGVLAYQPAWEARSSRDSPTARPSTWSATTGRTASRAPSSGRGSTGTSLWTPPGSATTRPSTTSTASSPTCTTSRSKTGLVSSKRGSGRGWESCRGTARA